MVYLPGAVCEARIGKEGLQAPATEAVVKRTVCRLGPRSGGRMFPGLHIYLF